MNKELNVLFMSIVLLFVVIQVKGQQCLSSKPVSIQIELLGTYNMIGVSYDQRFTEKNDGFGYKVGLGIGYSKDPWKFIPFKFNTWGGFPNQKIVSLPLQINYLLGKNNHKLETSAGVTPFYSSYKFNETSHINAYGTLSIGYRYYNLSNNVTFSTGLMLGYKLPGLKMNYVDDFFWQPYISIGYILK